MKIKSVNLTVWNSEIITVDFTKKSTDSNMHNPWWIYNNHFLVQEGMCGSNEIGYFLQNDAYFDETTPCG